MKKVSLILSLLAIFILSCQSVLAPTATVAPPTSTPLPSPTPTDLPPATPVCISGKPTQADIDRALSFVGQAFSTEWERSYTVNDTRVMVSWTNINRLAYLEALIYPCGYEEPDINAYYSEENWKTVFANYDSYQPLNQCRTNAGQRLYRFTAKNMGYDYLIHYWVQNDTDTRVIGMMLVFPIEEKDLLEEYSAKFFPRLPNCP